MPLLARCCGSCAIEHPHPQQCPQNLGHHFHTWSNFSVGIYVEYFPSLPFSILFPGCYHPPPHPSGSLTQLRNVTFRNVSVGGGERVTVRIQPAQTHFRKNFFGSEFFSCWFIDTYRFTIMIVIVLSFHSCTMGSFSFHSVVFIYLAAAITNKKIPSQFVKTV